MNEKKECAGNVARTAAQIDCHRLYSLTGAEAGLVAYYRFDSAAQIVTNLAISTGAILNATLGPDANANAEDPVFTHYGDVTILLSGAALPGSFF